MTLETKPFSAAEIAQLRDDTPGVSHRIHLNNAGAALMPTPVVAAVTDYLNREAQIGGYETKAERSEQIEGVYSSVARLVGAAPDEIALAENATVAWQWAFYAQSFKPGDRILTTTAEYAANYLAYLQVAKRTGAVIEIIPDGADGLLDPDALDRIIDDRTRLIAITWVPTNGGLVNPAHAVGKVARRHGIPYLLDACQAVGQMPVDVEAIGCDMLAATGRKFLRGPRGTGFLYMRRELIERTEPAMIDMFGAEWAGANQYTLRSDARRFETWESDYAARVGLGTAVDYALSIGLERIEQRSRSLATQLRSGLAAIDGVTTYDVGQDPVAIVTFTVHGREASDIAAALSKQGINVSVSRPTSTPIDSTKRGLDALVRASPHYYNTTEEIDRTIAAVANKSD
ncbi:aminotransferase class V-fold PLP-dependent enzyme [Mycoplana rhizolycopersici]|uniref:Aminotransferase class V-fold PLP-dependent enzyme n=1 Tax=Mycoplana rhizolycopersici TaxID=2746702 RepID=A0ABX2QMS0_9HYPH|nr:aminotransferase class V-fold PLP-dependent enzyme [Rhizobium rhizolycopersici]NVP57614.1 aminotransferase class V-fold PLP-dependent enzyme [Rhizobium rhizolycopersici]